MHTKNSTEVQAVVRVPHESTTIIVTTPSWECTEINQMHRNSGFARRHDNGEFTPSCNKSDSRLSRKREIPRNWLPSGGAPSSEGTVIFLPPGQRDGGPGRYRVVTLHRGQGNSPLLAVGAGVEVVEYERGRMAAR